MSVRGLPARASVRGRRVLAIPGRNWRQKLIIPKTSAVHVHLEDEVGVEGHQRDGGEEQYQLKLSCDPDTQSQTGQNCISVDLGQDHSVPGGREQDVDALGVFFYWNLLLKHHPGR